MPGEEWDPIMVVLVEMRRSVGCGSTALEVSLCVVAATAVG